MFKNRVAYGVYNQLERIKNDNVYLKAKGSTLFYLNRLSGKMILSGHGPMTIICDDDIYSILEKAHSQKYDYCVVVAAGCQIRNWRFHLDLDEFLQNNTFGVAGHPLWWPNNAWPELHHQFFIVNLAAWDAVGRPAFGSWETTNLELPVLERSNENFHDDYTPLWIKHTGIIKSTAGAGQGWELMSAMFKGGYSIITLTEKLRLSKFYTYPEHDTSNFEKSINELSTYKEQNWNQQKWINDSKCTKDQVWLFNSEDLNIYNKHGPYDVIVSTASGFKIFNLFDNRIKDTTRCIIYDFNPISLSWYRHFHTWPNENLEECIHAFPEKDNFTWPGQQASKFTADQSFYDCLEENYTFAGGKENFIQKWNKFKCMPVEFKKVDLYSNPESLALLLKGPGKKWINLTNIFSTDAVQLIFGHQNCMAAQNRLLGSLYIVDPFIDVALFDFWNRPKIGYVKDLL